MPYTRIWIPDEDAEHLLELARAQERSFARDAGRKPKRITLRHAAAGCLWEGLADLEARSDGFRDDEDDEEGVAD